MNLEKEFWFDETEQNHRGYAQIEERLYFLQHANLMKYQRDYELAIIESFVDMIPNVFHRLSYRSRVVNYKRKVHDVLNGAG